MNAAQQQVQQQFERGEVSREQYDALQREIIDTEQSLRSLEEQAAQTNTVMSRISEASDKVGKFGESATAAGKKMLPVTAAIGAAGGASAKMAMDFEDSMAKVNTIADTTKVPLSDLEKSILDLSNQTGISSSEIANNVYDAISAGQETGDAVNFVSNSTKLAKAGFADAGSALDVLTTIMNAYGLEASEVTKVSDTLIQTQNLGKTTVGELSSSMGKIIPTAKANGVALDQVAAGYAKMTANGVATAETTTYMNSMMNELGKSGTKVSDTLKEKTGKSFSELMESGCSLADVLAVVAESAQEQGLAFSDLWGSAEAGKAGLILLGEGAEEFNSTLEDMRNSTGATDAAFEKLNTNSYTIEKAMNQLKNTAIELGKAIMDVLAPMLGKLAEKISAFSSWFSGLSDETKKLIVTIAAIVAAVGPLLIVIGKIATGISAVLGIVSKLTGVVKIFEIIKTAASGLFTFLVANPVVAIIAGVIAAIVLLYTKCEWFRDAVHAVWEAIKGAFAGVWNFIISFFTEKIPNAWNSLVSFFSGIPQWWSELWEGIKLKISEIWTSIKETVSGIVSSFVDWLGSIWDSFKEKLNMIMELIKEGLYAAWNAIKEKVTEIVSSFVGKIAELWESLKEKANAAMEKIQAIFSQAWDTIASKISDVWNGIQQFFFDTLANIGGFFSDVWNGIMQTVSDISQSIVQKIKDIWGSIVSWFGELAGNFRDAGVRLFESLKDGIASTIGNVADTIKNGIDNAVNFIKDLPGNALTWGKDFMTGFVNGIKNGINSLINAVKDVAGTITSYLHFSVPDVGPLTEYESWMPDFMEGLAKGIEQSRRLVEKPIQKVAESLVLGNPAQTDMQISNAKEMHKRGTQTDAILDMLAQYLPMLESQRLYLNNGVLAGELAPMIDRKIGAEKNRRERR